MKSFLLTTAIALALFSPAAFAADQTAESTMATMQGYAPPGGAPSIDDMREKSGCDARAQAEKTIAEGGPGAEQMKDALQNPALPSAEACKARAEREDKKDSGGSGGGAGPVSAVQPVAPVAPAQ